MVVLLSKRMKLESLRDVEVFLLALESSRGGVALNITGF